jgi:quinol monooxygenase YgiN
VQDKLRVGAAEDPPAVPEASMITVVGKMQVQPGKAEAFERLWLQLQAAVQANEPGCLVYRLTRSRDAPDTYRNIEMFHDQAAMDAHTAADYFQALAARLGEHLAGVPEVEFLDSID